jgi:putative RNA 2'-phosphotransferase
MATTSPSHETLATVSRVLSKILRHEPELVGLRLDKNGWVKVDDLLEALTKAARSAGSAKRIRKLPEVSRQLLMEVVSSNDKQRFAISGDGERIRAVQGHSLEVHLAHPVLEPPAVLFHGTAAANRDSISAQGITRGTRHAVHLSVDAVTAKAVGSRHGPPMVLEVDAGQMHRDGHEFSVADNGTWLVEHVPPQYIRRRK